MTTTMTLVATTCPTTPLVLHLPPQENRAGESGKRINYYQAYINLLAIFQSNIIPNVPPKNDLEKKLVAWAKTVMNAAPRLNPENEELIAALFDERVSELRKILVNIDIDSSPLKKPVQLPGGQCVSQWICEDWMRTNKFGRRLFERSPLDEKPLHGLPPQCIFPDRMIGWLSQFTLPPQMENSRPSSSSHTGDGEFKDGQLAVVESPSVDRLHKKYMKHLASLSPEKDDERRMRYLLLIRKRKNEVLEEMLDTIEQDFSQLETDYLETTTTYEQALSASEDRLQQTLADLVHSRHEITAAFQTQLQTQNADHREREEGLIEQLNVQNQAHIETNRLHEQQIADTRQAHAEAREASNRQTQEIQRTFQNETLRLSGELAESREACQTAREIAQQTQENNAQVETQLNQTRATLQETNQKLEESKRESAENGAKIDVLHQQIAAEQRKYRELQQRAEENGGGGGKCVLL